MLPTDMALIEDEKFLPYVKKCTFSFCRGSWRVPPTSCAKLVYTVSLTAACV